MTTWTCEVQHIRPTSKTEFGVDPNLNSMKGFNCHKIPNLMSDFHSQIPRFDFRFI